MTANLAIPLPGSEPPADSFTEIELMLAAWHGSESTRAIAFEIADRNRVRGIGPDLTLASITPTAEKIAAQTAPEETPCPASLADKPRKAGT